MQPLQWFLMVFGVPGGRKTSPNARKLLEESLPKFTQILMDFLCCVFLIFKEFWGPSWTQFSSKIAPKGGTEFNSTPLFWRLRFFSYWGYPQAPIWVDFWLIWKPILVYFGTNKRTRNCYNKPASPNERANEPASPNERANERNKRTNPRTNQQTRTNARYIPTMREILHPLPTDWRMRWWDRAKRIELAQQTTS